MSKILSIAVAILLGMSSYDGYKLIKSKMFEVQPVQALTSLPTFSISENKESTKKYYTNPMVRILDDAGNFICTGTVISKDYVLTAAHCLYDKSQTMTKSDITVCFIATDKNCVAVIKAKAAAINIGTDNGLIVGDFNNFTTYELYLANTGYFDMGTKLVVCGFPYGRDPACFGQPVTPKVYQYRFAMEGVLYPGMSGGPVYDLDNQKVMGVNSAIGQGFIIVTSLVGLFEQLGVVVVD